MTGKEDLTARFERSRPRLLAIANRLLSSDADAQDAVQEAWLRLQRTDAGAIVNLEAWLTTVVSRISLDMLRAPRRMREYSWQVEPWRDEPLALDGDPAEEAERSDQVGVALLVVLETLSPAERVAFILHDVFGQPFDQVAEVLEKSVPASRQLASRARRHLRGAPDPARPGPHRARELVDAWLVAAQQGNFTALLGLLDESAVLRADYGTSNRVIEGPAAIAEQAVLSARLAAHSTPILIDGRPGVAAVLHGRVVSIMAFAFREGRIIGLDVLADPGRLGHLEVDDLRGRT
ncbi:sigma-70 family RNA polymerase sigma factor [Paeniglutamicibacter psychrophenolicus]|uniref:RNA polymerase sigma-70 factor (ECF subfamily) n=1 Tax=Paeniglutamicibacter psychrophenolicus TaxID=257454 RepID=A0ABS4W9Z2_9MICC|nr:sigma-70 family RNA polymerase sigma factor [Paeniglutamicibacter psychrophenolicus]MBP2373026.1 RNA polymerase sigma-70 factor (ECF subfamily) [Paeniglutamicibacter psychrophenolicus]